ncbi:MAG: TonB-dependent siderophore receptor [Novosphingobium sp.]
MLNLPTTACRLLLSTCALTAISTSAWASEAAAEAEGLAIVVLGQQDGYKNDTASATKTGTPLIDVPQSVAIISRAQLDDQAIDQLNDALRYVPGVILSLGEGHRDQVSLRGQASTADFYLDGLRDDVQYYRPLYNTERVEVLKGANAMLFGRGGGGGVINRVSKSPDFARTSGAASAGVDTFGAWSLAADVNHPFSDSAALRINGTYEEFANHRDVYNGRFIGIAPTLALKLDDATRLTLAYEYVDDARVTDRGVPSLGGVPITGYDKTFFGSAALNHSTVQAHFARARLEHDLSDNLTVNFTGQYNSADKFYSNAVPASATATTVKLTGYASGTQRQSWIGQGNLVWKTATGPLRHTLLVGFEGASQVTDATRQDLLFGGLTTSPAVPLARTITLPAANWSAINRQTHSDVTALSAYIQDQIELGDYVQVVGGLRYDQFRITSLTSLPIPLAAARRDGTWSPRLGLIVKPMANLSIYTSYAKSFLPQSGDQFGALDVNTATLAPESFRNLEAGVKWDIARDLSFTAAVYQLDRTNSRVTDPNTSLWVLTGKSRVNGFEASLAGHITPQWQASVGFARQDGTIRSPVVSGTTTIAAGRHLPLLPKGQFTAWTRYDVTPKLGLGLGLVHQSSQFASISNNVTLPAFTRLDASVYYNVTKAFTIQLNVENLTDTHYNPSAGTDNNIATGEPINARLTARVKF